MPCCALAACIVGQLLLAIGVAKSWLFGSSPAAEGNAVVEWSLGDPRPSGSAPEAFALRARRVIPWLVAVEVAIVVATFFALRGHVDHEAHAGHAVHVHAAESPRR